MKNLYLTLLLLLSPFFIFAQGVKFENLTYQEALSKAKAENKLVFVDCYTSWCGPCHEMLKNVFPQPSVGDYMNKKFVCVKFDMEKGEGPELSNIFDIYCYPTFVFVKPDGKIQHKFTGWSSAEEFIEKAKATFDENKALGLLEEKYEKGVSDKEFLITYIHALDDGCSYEKAIKVVEKLIKNLTLKEKISKEMWFIYRNRELSPRNSENEHFLLEHRNQFRQIMGAKEVNDYIYQYLIWDLGDVITKNEHQMSEAELDALKKQIQTLNLKREPVLLATWNIAKAVKEGNITHILEVMEKNWPKVNYLPARQYLYHCCKKIVKNEAESHKDQMDKILETSTDLLEYDTIQ